MLQVQISLFSNKGYRPLSTIVNVESVEEWNKNKQQIKMKAVLGAVRLQRNPLSTV